MPRRYGFVPLCGLLLAVWLTHADAASAERVEPTVFARLGPLALHGNEPDALTLGLGAFDIGQSHTSAAANLEYRFGRKLYFVGPSYGLVGNMDGGLLGYVLFKSVSGDLQQLLGYQAFFLWVLACALPVFVLLLWLPLREEVAAPAGADAPASR